MRIRPISKKTRNILATVFIAVVLRAWAVSLLPVDYDEPVYLQAAFDIADSLRHNDLNSVIDRLTVREHPALVQLIYSGGILMLRNADTWTNAFYTNRAISAVFGVLAVLLLSIGVDPLAGGLLAVHTMAVKYTSQVYLEAIPLSLSTASVLAFLRADGRQKDPWFWISAIALGAATAGKFTYIPVILIVLTYIAFVEKKINLSRMVMYALVALTVFLALDITLWGSPFSRLTEMLIFHGKHSRDSHVQMAGYPWYQPIIWVASSAPARWHPNVFFYYGFDGLIFLSAILGLKREWIERRWLVIWLMVGLSFLLIWPTKWPQYTLSITTPICIMAAGSIRQFYFWVREQEDYWNYFKEFFPMPDNWFWWALSAFAAFIAIIYLSTAMKVAVGRVGWSHFTEENSFLPDDTVYDLLPLDDGRTVIATERGAAIWQSPPGTDLPDRWVIFTTSNSGLPSNRVLSLLDDQKGGIWFGTSNGVAIFQNDSWRTFGSRELGQGNAQVNALATGDGNQIFAATLSGVSVWDGVSWEVVSGFEGEEVFSIALAGETIFAATNRGITEINLTSDDLVFYPTDEPARSVIVDSAGTVWAGTNNGLGRLDNGKWEFYTTTNSGLPLNFVNTVTEINPGNYWIATSNATSASGILVQFDGTQWKSFLESNSGFSGSEPLTIAISANGQVWIGTRTRGIDVFQLGR